LEFNVPFQHKYGYIRDERTLVSSFQRADSVGWVTGTHAVNTAPEIPQVWLFLRDPA